MTPGNSNLYPKIYTDRNLALAWDYIRHNGKSAGVDSIDLGAFNQNLLAHLKSIQKRLANGSYHPKPPRRFFVFKKSGEKRPLGILTVEDRLVQRAVLNVIELIFEKDFSPASFAFRKGRNVQQAAEEVRRWGRQGYLWVVDLDIESFFDTVDRSILMSFIAEKIQDKKLLGLVKAWLRVDSSGNAQNKFNFRFKPKRRGPDFLKTSQSTSGPGPDLLKKFERTSGRGILQGGVLSPLFANIYLNRFDWTIQKSGFKLVRYADDAVILGRSKQEARRALHLARQTLARLKLRVNDQKTRITHLSQGITFLGEKIVIKPGNGRENNVRVHRRECTGR